MLQRVARIPRGPTITFRVAEVCVCVCVCVCVARKQQLKCQGLVDIARRVHRADYSRWKLHVYVYRMRMALFTKREDFRGDLMCTKGTDCIGDSRKPSAGRCSLCTFVQYSLRSDVIALQRRPPSLNTELLHSALVCVCARACSQLDAVQEKGESNSRRSEY